MTELFLSEARDITVHGRKSLGMNPHMNNYWNTIRLLNLMKQCGPWGPEPTVQDANGYPDEDGTFTASFSSGGHPIDSGYYELTWDGTSVVNLTGTLVSNITSGPNWKRFHLNSDINWGSAGISVVNSGGSRATNIEIVRIAETNAGNPGGVHPGYKGPGLPYTEGEILVPWYKDRISHHQVIRPLWWMSEPNSRADLTGTFANSLPWDAYSWQTSASYNDHAWPWFGMPYAAQVKIVNDAQADFWITIPRHADDQFITDLATYVRDNLADGLMPIFEDTNEAWGPGFSAPHCRWMAQLEGWYPDAVDVYSPYLTDFTGETVVGASVSGGLVTEDTSSGQHFMEVEFTPGSNDDYLLIAKIKPTSTAPGVRGVIEGGGLRTEMLVDIANKAVITGWREVIANIITDISGWTASGASATGGVLNEGTSTGSHYLEHTYSVGGDTGDQVMRVLITDATAPAVRLTLDDLNGTIGQADIDLSDGSVNSSANFKRVYSRMLPNGDIEVVLQHDNTFWPSPANFKARVQALNASFQTSYTGTSQTITFGEISLCRDHEGARYLEDPEGNLHFEMTLNGATAGSYVFRLATSDATFSREFTGTSKTLDVHSAFVCQYYNGMYSAWYGKRTVQMCDLVEAVFAETGRPYLTVLAWQAGYYGSFDGCAEALLWQANQAREMNPRAYVRPVSVVDAIAIAPYMGNFNPKTFDAANCTLLWEAFDGTGGEQDAEALRVALVDWDEENQVFTGALAGSAYAAMNTMSQYAARAKAEGKRLFAYEGGNHSFNESTTTDLHSGGSLKPGVGDALRAAIYSTQAGDLWQAYFDHWKSVGGEVFCNLTDDMRGSLGNGWFGIRNFEDVDTGVSDAFEDWNYSRPRSWLPKITA